MQREETGSQSALGGEPDAVARRAESLTHRGDESDSALRAVSKLEAGRGPGSGVLYGDKRKEVFDLLLDAQAWDDLLVRPDVVAVQRHELDEPHLIALAARELRELDDLVIVAVLHHHHVQLDGPQARLFRGLDAVHRAAELVAASHLVETLHVQRVERDVYPLEARLLEQPGLLAQQHAVGRHRDVERRVDRVDHADELLELDAHQWLAARDADRAHAVALDEDARQPRDLLVSQDVFALQPLEAFRGHAVDAAEVAAVGHRDPEVIRMAPVGVD